MDLVKAFNVMIDAIWNYFRELIKAAIKVWNGLKKKIRQLLEWYKKKKRKGSKNHSDWQQVQKDHQDNTRMTIKVQDMIQYKQQNKQHHHRGIKRK